LTGVPYIEFKKLYPNREFYPCTFFKISGEETKDMENDADEKLDQQ
jgi:hypothetical protein